MLQVFKTLKLQVTQGPQLKLQVIQDTQDASYIRPSTQVRVIQDTQVASYNQGPQPKLQVLQDTQDASYTRSATQVTNNTRPSRCKLLNALN